MKSFWIVYLFVLLMCSCKTKRAVSDVKLDTKHTSETSYLNKSVEIDTTKTVYSTQLSEFKLIHETITETIYDTDKEVVEKVTETKRTFVQDTQTDIAEEEQKRLEIHTQDTLNHLRKTTEKMESETEEESIGGQEVFGRWLAIIIGLAFVGLIIYLRIKMKLRVN